MRLKSLEILGFKSFVDKTVILFEDGITGIVGPNGAGKSNLVDAIRWVMGEQSAKHLRGSAMSDVIFNGTDSRQPMGLAQVFLTFDNSDGRAPAEYANCAEIQVGRRLYRSGDSEYFINKTPCRLKDIIDLFLGTGIGTKAYSIVEQGRIGQIVSSKPEDRRSFIEEAAGISKFKSRKESALRKIESTKANLLRLSDIISELRRQINSLTRQASKAKRYKEYTDELRGLDLKLGAFNYKKYADELRTVETELRQYTESEIEHSALLSQRESEIEESRLNVADIERQVDDAQRKVYELNNSVELAKASIDYKTRECDRIKDRRDLCQKEIELLGHKRAILFNELKDSNEFKVESDIKLATIREKVLTWESDLSDKEGSRQSILEETEAERTAFANCTSEFSSNSLKLEHIEKRQVELTEEIAKHQTEIDNIDREIVKIDGNLSDSDKSLIGLKETQTQLKERLVISKETLNDKKKELNALEQELKPLKGEVELRRSKSASLKQLQESYEGYQKGVQAIMKRSKEAQEEYSGVLGTVSQFVETTPEYEDAVSAVLGEKLQYVVVKSQQEGVQAVEYLRAQTLGRSSFVPIEVKETSGARSFVPGEGIVGPMTDYVCFTDDYKNIGRHLLSDVVLVKDLKSALNVWNQSDDDLTYVTMDGDVVYPSGIVSGGGGRDVSKELIERERQIKELNVELIGLSQELAIKEQQEDKIRKEIKSLEEEIVSLTENTHTEEIRVTGRERDLTYLRNERESLIKRRDAITVETAELAEKSDELKITYSKSVAAMEYFSKEREIKQRAIEELKTRLGAIEGGVDEQMRNLTSLKVELAEIQEKNNNVTREINRLTQEVTSIDNDFDSRKGEIVSGEQTVVRLTDELVKDREELQNIISEHDKSKTWHQKLQEEYDEKSSAIREKEFAIRDIRKKRDESKENIHHLDIKQTEMNSEINHLSQNIFEKYHVDIPSRADEYYEVDLDVVTFTERSEELKSRIEKLGTVSSDAIQEFDELKERYEFLSKQYDDLNVSLDSLQKAIQKINKTSKKRFHEAFNEINDRFVKLFPKLFEGGKAKLVLTDESNILESGVEIIAQPPGKKLQSISLLSGGEKALTAVALIFAIFLYRPSPFCLLDEVDAPLDDANIDRFNNMIRSMTPHSQFILITHNKRTMELADLLYGVTMEERGASKIVSVRLNEGVKDQAVA